MEKTLRYRWVILAIAFISQSFGAIWNLQKIVPVLPELMKTWGISLESASLLAAIYGIGLIIFSIPSGIMAVRFGFRKVGFVALTAVLIGSLIDSFAMEYWTMFIGRLIGGLGFGIIFGLTISLVALWFPPHELGLALGLEGNTWAVGASATLNVVGILTALGNWRLGLMLGAIFAFISLILWTGVKPPPISRASPSNESIHKHAPDLHGSREAQPSMFVALKNLDNWLVSFALAIGFFIPSFAFLTLMPRYWTNELGIDIAMASFYLSLITLTDIPMSIIGGALSDKLNTRRKLYVVGFLSGAAVYAAFIFATGARLWLIPALCILRGIIDGLITSPTKAAARELLGPLAPIGIGIQTTFMGVGSLIGAPIAAAAIVPMGWEHLFYACAIESFLGAIIGSLARKVR